MKRRIFDILLGVIIGVVVVFFLYRFTNYFKVTPTDDNIASISEEEKSAESVKARDVVFSIGDKEVTLHTPAGFYYLTDEYVSNLSTYYSANTDGLNMFVVGDKESTSVANTILTASTVEDDIEFSRRLYEDKSLSADDESQWPLSYHYYKKGEKSEYAPDDYSVEKVAEFEAQGMKFTAYYETYSVTQEYTISENDTQEYTTDYKSVIAYSDSSNPMEFVVYCDEDGVDNAVELIKEVLGVK